MTTFYTLDRSGGLAAGLELRLAKHNITPPELGAHADSLFPDGVSGHGNRHLLCVPGPDDEDHAKNARIESYFEAVRVGFYPARPSRFVCMFAWESLDDARGFRVGERAESSAIYEVHADRWFKADMRLLKLGSSVLCQSYLAHQYWQGRAHPSGPPVWEVMLALPVTVGQKVA